MTFIAPQNTIVRVDDGLQLICKFLERLNLFSRILMFVVIMYRSYVVSVDSNNQFPSFVSVKDVETNSVNISAKFVTFSMTKFRRNPSIVMDVEYAGENQFLKCLDMS